MSAPDICQVCGQPADQHHIEVIDGAAHTVSRAGAGNWIVHCSLEYANLTGLRWEIRRLLTIIRSLRMRSGRAWNMGDEGKGAVLEEYAQFIERERNRLIAIETRRKPQ